MSSPQPKLSLRAKASLRAQVTEIIARGFFEGLSRAGRLHPQSRPEAHNIEVIQDVSYTQSGHGDHRLDIYRRRDLPEKAPVVLYIHGGGFHMLSKDTHWLMGLLFARAGYVVFNISYRLAPKHCFPAAMEDASDALVWLHQNAERYGGDLERLAFAGESAGANLALSLAISSCSSRPELYAQRAFQTGRVPKALLLGCGMLQVSDAARLWRRRAMPWWIRGAVNDLCTGYLGAQAAGHELADPLLLMERDFVAERPFPSVYAFAGTKDPVLEDTRRLGRALAQRSEPHAVRLFPGEVHAFHALLFRKAARDCWREQLAFLERVVKPVASPFARIA